ncbi:hypothetical protein AGMMS49975_28100 [Clostridia bacterium]|nr:hypothetical protein AGMMS49975_28100 [Clostridia bacterium]
MANYHMEFKIISRGQGRSVTKAASYINGEKLRDDYNGETHYNRRQDVIYREIFQPVTAPPNFHDLQKLCEEIDKAENRYDARTAREFKGSLPNELPLDEIVRIIREYVEENFIVRGLCAIAAIHEGKNASDPTKNNPHVHIIVPTRAVGRDGFNKKKDREHNNIKYASIWREQWAEVQNRAYERNRLDIRVNHESLEVQGIRDREPTIHLSRIDWQREKSGERTIAGDKKRDIERRNNERLREKQLEREYELEFELSR